MNLKYMKVSLFEISYKKKLTFSRHSNLPFQSKMAVRADAAASLSPYRTVFSCFLSCKSQCFCTSSSRLPVFKRAYSREFLLDVGRITFLEINSGPRCCGTLVCSGGLHHHRPPLLHLAHSGGATSGVRGSRRGVSAEVSDNDSAALAKKAQQRLYFLRKLRRARAASLCGMAPATRPAASPFNG